jgi:uncharacterized tellurite resistance protein B-like protein
MSISKGPLQVSQLKWITDILMGAAYADGTFEGEEGEAVKRVLKELLDGGELPDELIQRMYQFDPKEFDLQAACDQLQAEDAEDRRFLLNLASTITESDESHDLDESAYIRRLGGALGASPEEYKDLTVEIISISGVRKPPPPLPTRKQSST